MQSYQEFREQFHISLDQQQECAVRETAGAVQLLAVPGSGKTTVLITRLGYLIHCLGVMPEQILTVTYTVAATQDMRSRYAEAFGAADAERIQFRTINGLAQLVLQYYGSRTGRSVFDVIGTESTAVLKNIYRAVSGEFAAENDIRNLQTGIAYVKNRMLTPEETEKLDVGIEKFPEMYRKYNETLRREKKIDYDDQLVYAHRILKQFPEVLAAFRQRYRYISVDEAQDTSKIQHEIIRLLAGQDGNLFMVGDEDQSIYGFRAAYPEALLSFEKQHPGARVLLMETNYRSRAEIAEAADRFIQKNKKRHQKHMHASREAGGIFRKIPVRTRAAQYRYLLKIAEAEETDTAAGPENTVPSAGTGYASAGHPAGDTAVLYRNNESALPLIDLLSRRGIPYCLKKSDTTYFTHPVVRDIRDFLVLALHPWDSEAFMRIYYKMGAGISRELAAHAVREADMKHGFFRVIAETKGAAPYVKRQCAALETHFRNMAQESAGRAVYRIIHFMGYGDYMENRKTDPGKAEILQILGEQEADIQGFLDRMEELDRMVHEGTDSGGITLSTIHASKGLEYSRVYLADILDGVLPAAEAEDPEYEEERRLFYVAMTRAREELYLFSFPASAASPFVREVFPGK